MENRSKKVLIVATVVQTHIAAFHLPTMKMLKENGWTVEVASHNDYENPEDMNLPNCDAFYEIPFARSPFSFSNIKAYKMLKKLIDDGHYDVVHCHTPVGGVLTRLAARRARKNGTKVFYTAHGFHFFKGAPIANWVLWYPVEKFCSRFTDILITINKEDYAFAKNKFEKRKCRVEYIPGVGIDRDRFKPNILSKEERETFREKLGLGAGDKMLLSVGELIPRKNHEAVLRVLPSLPDNVHYFIAGRGELHDYLLNVAKDLGVSNRFHLLGFRSDTPSLYNSADLFVFPSKQEGLPVALIEAIACGTNVICSKIRGNNDITIVEQQFPLGNKLCLADLLNAILYNSIFFGNPGVEAYDVIRVNDVMKKIYECEVA